MSTLPESAHMGRVVFRVTNADRALVFYRDVLGMTAVPTDGGVTLSPPGGEPLLDLIERPDAIRKPSRTIGLYHVAILLSDRSWLGAVVNRLIAAGYPIQGASDHGVSEALYLADPDGNGLEIYRDRPRDQWPPSDGTSPESVAMYTQPMDADGVMAAAPPGDYPGFDPGARIGHVHLHVSDLAAAEAFYVDALGFTVTQRAYPGALFVAAGGYHHHLGLNVWAGKRRPPENAVGLESFTVVIPDGVDAAVERLRAAGYRLETDKSGAWRTWDGDGNQIKLID